MKLAFFSVPALAPAEAAQELNRFLAAHRVLAVDRQLVTERQGSLRMIFVPDLETSSSAGAETAQSSTESGEGATTLRCL